jgi:hypothetical protein
MSGITFEATAPTAPEVAEGLYPADFDGAEPGPDGQYGPSIRWNFTAYVEGEATPVSGLSSTSGSSKSKASKWITAILGRQPEVGEKISFDDLVGKKCRVMVEDNSNGWPTITDIKTAK